MAGILRSVQHEGSYKAVIAPHGSAGKVAVAEDDGGCHASLHPAQWRAHAMFKDWCPVITSASS